MPTLVITISQCFSLIRTKMAFIMDQGIFCYKMMPLGLKNTSATYQRMMTRVFEGMIGAQVEVYIGNIITKDLNTEDHIVDL